MTLHSIRRIAALLACGMAGFNVSHAAVQISNLTVNAASQPVQVQTFGLGAKLHTDNDWVVSSLPEALSGHTHIITSNVNCRLDVPTWITFTVAEPVSVVVLTTNSTVSTWLAGWENPSLTLYRKDYHANIHRVYRKDFPAGTISLPGPATINPGADYSPSFIILPQAGASLFSGPRVVHRSVYGGNVDRPYGGVPIKMDSLTGTPNLAIIEGGLPPGLSLNAATGAITGAPAAMGRYYFTVRLTDGSGKAFLRRLKLLIEERWGEQPPNAHYTLPLDAQGWTIMEPKADSRIIYISDSTGSDSNSGLSSSAPKKTISAGLALLRNGYPDFALLKRGDTFTSQSVSLGNRVGRSPAEPIVIGAYGTGARPILQGGGGINMNPGGARNLLIRDLHFRNQTSGVLAVAVPNALMSHIYMENIYGEHSGISLLGVTGHDEDFAVRYLTIRRCTVAENYNPYPSTSRISGVYIDHARNVLFEENVVDMNGWSDGLGYATIYNHNFYIQFNTREVTLRNNLIARASSVGAQLRGGGVAEGNVFIENNFAFFVGLGSPDGDYASPPPSFGRASHNVVLHAGTKAYEGPNGARGWGVQMCNQQGNIAEENIIAHGGPGDTVSNALFDIDGVITTGNVVHQWGSDPDLRGTGYPYPDAGRDLIQWDLLNGGPGNIDNFLRRARLQSRENWDSQYTARAIRNYIREGFGMLPWPAGLRGVAQTLYTESGLVLPATLTHTDDEGTGPYTYSISTPPAVGTLVQTGPATWNYTSPGGYTGEVTFAYQVTSPTDTSEPVTIRIVVNPLGGSAAAISLTRAGVPVPAGSVDPFEQRPFGLPFTVEYTITNSGNIPLTLWPAAIGTVVNAAAQILTHPASTLAPGLSTTFTVQLVPSEGVWSVQLRLPSNAPASPFTWTVGGTTVSSRPYLHYTFDQTSGTTIVDSGDAPVKRNATAPNSTSWIADGAVDGAYGNPDPTTTTGTFPGFDVPSSADLPLNPQADAFTIALWVKHATTQNYRGLFDKTGGATQLRLWISGTPEALQLYVGGVNAIYDTTNAASRINDGAWHHLAVVNTQVSGIWRAHLYYDGQKVLDFASGTSVATGPLTIGKNNSRCGQKDDFRLYLRALSPAEIQGLMDLGAEPPSGYTAWADGINWNGADSTPEGDPEKDGVLNLVEYGLGGNPLAPDPVRLPVSAVAGNHLTLSFQRAAADLTYEVLAKGDLSASGWSVIATNPGTVGELVTVQDPVALSAGAPRFMRLRLTLP